MSVHNTYYNGLILRDDDAKNNALSGIVNSFISTALNQAVLTITKQHGSQKNELLEAPQINHGYEMSALYSSCVRGYYISTS